jgi:hypothetical protein
MAIHIANLINRKTTFCFTAVVLLLMFVFTVIPVTADEYESEIDELVQPTGDVESFEVLPSETESSESEIIDEATSDPLSTEISEPEDTTVREYSALPEVPVEMQSFRMLDSEIPPGTLRRLSWYTSENLAGLTEGIPVLVAHGTSPGPRLCIVAAVHGDELNGIEIVRTLLHELSPAKLSGTVIGVPIVNLYGFRQGSRYLADRRDLNRYFPGRPGGSAASRIAHSFFSSVVVHCDYLIDLHTGSFHRTNLPQIRADLNNEGVLHLTKGFGATVVLHGKSVRGSLRAAAVKAGIPALTLEVGEPMRYQPDEVAHGVKGLRSLLNHLGMVSTFRFWREPQPTYYRSSWVRADNEGILRSSIKLGQSVKVGDLLGMIIDPITNARSEIRSPHNGRVLGMSLNQTMMPGYAAYHIGIRKTEEELVVEDIDDDNANDDEDDDPAESDAGEE